MARVALLRWLRPAGVFSGRGDPPRKSLKERSRIPRRIPVGKTARKTRIWTEIFFRVSLAWYTWTCLTKVPNDTSFKYGPL